MSEFLGQEVISQIRSANDIVEVIQWLNVPLKKAGANYRALCPFHKEKTPSFHVTPQKQNFHCFGCGVGGDVFKFVMLREGLQFIDAAHRLAERGRVVIPKNTFRQEGSGRDQRDRLHAIHLKVMDWYHANLMRSRTAEAARVYLRQRGFTSDTAKAFRLGYAPSSWDGLISWSKENGVELKLLEEAGLIVTGNRGAYDRFRDRLMIPIADEIGRISGFSGRLLSNEASEAKYVNSPETAIFKKGRLLFGLNHSKRDLQETQTAIVCEGQLDWIRCFESGIRNVIAPQGTAFTEEQARILNRYVEQVILCFDSDTAGQKATWRNAETLIATGLSVKAVRLPEKEDPDSLIRKQGVETLKKLIGEATDVFEYKAFLLAKSLNMKDPRNHQKIVLEMTPLIALVEDEPKRQRIIQNVSDILKMDTMAFLDEFRRQHRRHRKGQPAVPDVKENSPKGVFENQIMEFGDYFLGMVLHEEMAARMLAGHLEEEWFESYGLRQVLFHVIHRTKEGRWKPGWNGLDLELDDADRERVARLLAQSLEMNRQTMARGIQEAVSRVHRAYLLERHAELSRLLQKPDLNDENRLVFQIELLDLSLRIKHV